MKRTSIRPFLTLASACLLPAALQAQTTLQSAPTQPGGTTAQTVDVPVTTQVAPQMSPAASISQPYPPVSSDPAFSEPNTIRFRAVAGIERDSNVLRVAGPKISDEIGMLGVGVKADRRIGLQRFIADVEANRFAYNDLSGLDYDTLNYSAAWHWKFSNILEGIASADRRQFRDVTDTLGTVGGMSRRTERNELLEGGYRFGGGWRALAGVQHSATRSNDPRSFDASPELRRARFGASYEFGSGSTIAARVHRGEGEYANSVGNADFDESEFELTMRWVATAKTSVDARVAHLEREHAALPGRDFSGLVGNAAVNWDATAKTRFTAGASRDLGSYTFGTQGYVESYRIYFSPSYRPTTHIAVNARYERETRNWINAGAGSPDAGREDVFNVLAAGVDWEPRRAVTVSGTVRNERRKSSLPAFSYRANVIGVALKLTL